MVTKGEQTRERIIRESAILLNTRGYAGTAMSDIIEMTHIQKGGIYRHFDSKEAIALAAFDYALSHRVSEVQQGILPDMLATQQLEMICHSFFKLIENPALPGGCPIMNLAIEMDDSDSPLCAKAQDGFNYLRSLIQDVVKQGKSRGEIQPYVNGDVVATILISTCEGGLMMSKLYQDKVHLQRAIDHLIDYFETLKR